MSPNQHSPNQAKFTRGEKCIFVHVIITFALIIALIIIYFLHLWLVKHTRSEVFKISLRTSGQPLEILKHHSIGVVYLNMTPARILCNTLLLRHRWSLAPAQCTSMRTDPDMSQYLPLWKIKYRNFSGKHYETEVKRSLTHSRFNRDDFINNIGLFEHTNDLIDLKEYVVPNNMELDKRYSRNMKMFGWKFIPSSKDGDLYPYIMSVYPLLKERWSIYVTPIRGQLDTYEFCVVLRPIELSSGLALDHGALFVKDSNIMGFFSWGDVTGRGVPLTILNITHFRDWYENIISL